MSGASLVVPYPCAFLDLDIDGVDDEVWLMIPPRTGPSAVADVWTDTRAWARDVAGDLWADSGLDPGPDGVALLARTVGRCADALAPAGSEHWLFLHFEHPAGVPLPVLVAMGPASGPRARTLRALTGADDATAVVPPVVRAFTPSSTSRGSGGGLSTFRYVPQEHSPHLLACVRYAWRDEEYGVDLLLRTACEDTAHVLRAAGELEILAGSLGVAAPSGARAGARRPPDRVGWPHE